MLHVKLLGRGEKREFMRAQAALIRSQKKNIPMSWDFPMELIKTLKCIPLSSWVLTINEGLEKFLI